LDEAETAELVLSAMAASREGQSPREWSGLWQKEQAVVELALRWISRSKTALVDGLFLCFL
jgi:hypothetical protein